LCSGDGRFLSLFVAPGVVHAGDDDDALANFNAKNYALAAPLFDKAAKQNVDKGNCLYYAHFRETFSVYRVKWLIGRSNNVFNPGFISTPPLKNGNHSH
jgi:hypothetical protein